MGGKKGKKKSKKKKSYTKAQKMAKARIAAGKTISSVKASNKQKVKDAAAARHAKFKQTKVQTLGGKKTSFTKAEQKRITDAGYSVAGYSKAKPNVGAGTAAMVAADNAQYGTSVPEGSFAISEAGRIQAEKNKAEAAAKKAAEAAAAKKAEAARVAAAKKEATRKSTFNPNRLRYQNKDYLTPTPYVNAFKRTFMGEGLQGNRFNPADRAAALGAGYTDSIIGAVNFGKNRLVPFGNKIPNIPTLPKFKDANLQGLRNFGSVAIPGLQTFGAANRLSKVGLGQEISQMTTSNAKYTAGIRPQLTKTGITDVNPLTIAKAFTPEMVATGPTAGASAALLGTTTALSAAQQAKAGETQTGGLNVGGGVDSGEAEGSKTGRTIFGISGEDVKNFGTFTSNLLQQPKAALAYGADVINQAFAPRLGDGTLTGNMDFAGNLPGDKGFDNRDVQIKSAVNNAMDSKFVQQYGENLGLPKNFKAQTKDALAALGENFKGATADRDGIYKGISETAKNLSSDDRLAPISKYLNQLGTDNENVTDADRNKKFSMMGFKTPFTNEKAADAITAFQPNVDKMPGLSFKDRGLIEGSGGNRIISGKLTDIAREAITGNIGSGDSLGIQKGTPLTIGNMIDAGSTIASNLQQDGTLASQRSKEIANLADKAGKITTPSLIKGLIPRFGGSGSFRPNAVSSLGQGATTLAAATPTSVEEVLPLPTTATQTGTDSGNLASIMQNAYSNQMSLYGMNPNYFASFQQPRFNRPRKRFRQVFNRGYF